MKFSMRSFTSIVLSVSTIVLSAVTFAQPASALAPGDKYVALGDSYASVGSLTAPQLKNPICSASMDNYAHKVAQRHGLQLDDATCAWALTFNYDHPQNHVLPFTALTGQREHLTPDTKLVTITLGGNDAGVGYAFPACFARALTGLGPDCRSTTQATIQKLIHDPGVDGRTLLQREVDIIKDVKHRAPDAKIIVTGYMNASKPENWCLKDGFLTKDEREFIAEAIDKVNEVVKEAADQTGVTYVAPPNEDKGWCDGIGSQASNSLLGLTDNTLPAHPTAAGQQRMADAISAHLNLEN